MHSAAMPVTCPAHFILLDFNNNNNNNKFASSTNYEFFSASC
jgi:hypothetical protein